MKMLYSLRSPNNMQTSGMLIQALDGKIRWPRKLRNIFVDGLWQGTMAPLYRIVRDTIKEDKRI